MEMKIKGLIAKKFWHSKWHVVGTFTEQIQELSNWLIKAKYLVYGLWILIIYIQMLYVPDNKLNVSVPQFPLA